MTNEIDFRRAYSEARPREFRFHVESVEIRAAESDDSFNLRGYASTTDVPYTVTDWLGDYTETIARGAFTKSLAESDDVRFLVNHDGIPLARTGSGTLTLREIANPDDDPQERNQTGLWSEANVDARSPLGQTVRSAVERGDMSQMSFAFQATRQTWSPDYTQRTIQEVRLFDVSVVTNPANPTTSIQVNSARMAGIYGSLAAGRALSADDAVFVRDQLAAITGQNDPDEQADAARSIAQVAEHAALQARQMRLDALKRRKF